jgi:hypothetical protein
MPVVTQYYDKISYVELSGNLTANELLTSVLKFNRGEKFKLIDIRIIDSTLVNNALLDLEKMKAFVAVDKRAFIDNDNLKVIFISTDETLIGLFKLYADMMSSSPWTFHTVTSIDDAEVICQKSNLSILSNMVL